MDSSTEKNLYTGVSMFQKRGPDVSLFRQFLNLLGCILVVPLYLFITHFTRHPATLDILMTIFSAEYNRFANESRRRQLKAPSHAVQDPENACYRLTDAKKATECMATIVGYREDPDLFARALGSYKTAAECRFVLVGVDGDDTPDMEMVHVFEGVFAEKAAVVHIDEPLGEIAMKTFEKLCKVDGNAQAVQVYMEATIAHCCQIARGILSEHDLDLGEAGGVTRLCLFQPHLHKKGIMFSAFIFSIVISEMLGIEYMWSSDSDTIILPDTLRGTIGTIAGDPHVGGGSAGLILHNENETITTKLAGMVYWSEVYVSRSTALASGISDCQSGPSTAFRVSALPAILYPWYTQTVMGHRMIVNEDRHLTTNLILRGWKVTFASDTLAATDTPTTLSRWLMQQVRWGRAGHIEALQQPQIYVLTNPLFLWAAFKREAGPLLLFGSILYYLITGRSLTYLNLSDLGLRVAYSLLYNFFRNPARVRSGGWLWIVPGILFYYIPLPIIHLWSLITVFQDGWGTSMRSSSEMSKRGKAWKRWKDLGFFVVWMGVVGGTLARMFANMAGWDETRIFQAIVLGMVVPSAASFYGLVICE
ncbi:unnamed protein product [Penicillium camemberti]|uniref:Str. FM013 n=1 Tax=Penicillium camemberti (strain FM 013) TaxID=1429867 RepID=A0A0G4PRZ7_PENC3|nr:unnamed protein product [Penicillium camemberti]